VIRIGVLASGEGSNLQAILDGCASGSIEGKVVTVLSNVASTRALARGTSAGAASEHVAPPSEKTPEARQRYDAQLIERLRAHQVDLVCLAGYMRLLSPTFIEAFQAAPCPRIMNIHPGLLPSFTGLHAQRQALAYGARFAGCTVHFVDGGVDTGPIIAQAVVPVLPEDTEATLQARILAEEHRLYPTAVQWFAAGRLRLEGRRVTVAGAVAPPVAALVNPR
jgi:phosphoribosylglycinamide formyltransferase 1